MKGLLRFVLMLTFVAAAIPARAQVQTGSILVKAVDQQGAVVPGVTITITSPVLVSGSMTAVTDAGGTYRFPSLVPGTYEVKLELSGGKLKSPIPRPLTDVTALPLSGAPGPGQYAIIDSIQLEQIKSALSPGDYLLKVKIVDTVSKQTYNLEQSFKITG